jgi:hypothetical protein
LDQPQSDPSPSPYSPAYLSGLSPEELSDDTAAQIAARDHLLAGRLGIEEINPMGSVKKWLSSYRDGCEAQDSPSRPARVRIALGSIRTPRRIARPGPMDRTITTSRIDLTSFAAWLASGAPTHGTEAVSPARHPRRDAPRSAR